MLTKEMQRALEADGEKLRALTGEDHGPFTPALAICPRCDGQGNYPSSESGERDEDCPDCNASGMLKIGEFNPICERHCHLCEGDDHHWAYDGAKDQNDEPLISCRHCTALRYFTEGDDDGADY